MRVSVKLPCASVRLVPDSHCVMTQDDLLTTFLDLSECVGSIKEVSNLAGLIMIAPDDVDVLALNPITVETTAVIVAVLGSKSEVPKMPKRIILFHYLIDPISEVVIHDIAGVTPEPQFRTGPVLLPVSIPRSFVPQVCFICFTQKRTLAILDDVAVPKMGVGGEKYSQFCLLG